MKKTVSYLIVSFLIINHRQTSFAQQVKNPEVKFLIDTTITIMKENAINANNVNWPALKENAMSEAENLKSPYELGPVMRKLYQAIGDFHGAFYYRDSIFQWRGRNNIISDSVKKQWNNRAGIKTAMLDNSIGYLRIPSMPFGRADFDAKAQALNDSLCKLMVSNLHSIVIDLRINGGGAMHPMIMGVEQLLGNGKIGAFQNKQIEDWVIKDNKLYIDTAILTKIYPKCNINAQSIPAVLLIGSGTGSSGEFLAIAFKGRKKTVFIGTESAGYTTANKGFKINDFATILLAVGYGKDRDNKSYKSTLQPDIYLKATENFDDVKKDACVIAAEKWINKH